MKSITERLNKIKIKKASSENINRYKQVSLPVVQLPLKYPAKHTPTPVSILRSSLFGIVKRGARKKYDIAKPTDDWPLITSWKNYQIRYIGFQLDQADLDTWLALLELSKTKGFGPVLYTTHHELLKIMGKSDGKASYNWLEASLERLRYCQISISTGELLYKGHLINTIQHHSPTQKLALALDQNIGHLFLDGYSSVDLSIRKKLKGDITKWLYGYICSHKCDQNKPHKISLEKLKELSGSNMENRKFKLKVNIALKQMQKVELIESNITKNILTISKKSTG